MHDRAVVVHPLPLEFVLLLMSNTSIILSVILRSFPSSCGAASWPERRNFRSYVLDIGLFQAFAQLKFL